MGMLPVLSYNSVHGTAPVQSIIVIENCVSQQFQSMKYLKSCEFGLSSSNRQLGICNSVSLLLQGIPYLKNHCVDMLRAY